MDSNHAAMKLVSSIINTFQVTMTNIQREREKEKEGDREGENKILQHAIKRFRQMQFTDNCD